jgi:hypothetical protein
MRYAIRTSLRPGVPCFFQACFQVVLISSVRFLSLFNLVAVDIWLSPLDVVSCGHWHFFPVPFPAVCLRFFGPLFLMTFGLGCLALYPGFDPLSCCTVLPLFDPLVQPLGRLTLSCLGSFGRVALWSSLPLLYYIRSFTEVPTPSR